MTERRFRWRWTIFLPFVVLILCAVVIAAWPRASTSAMPASIWITPHCGPAAKFGAFVRIGLTPGGTAPGLSQRGMEGKGDVAQMRVTRLKLNGPASGSGISQLFRELATSAADGEYFPADEITDVAGVSWRKFVLDPK